jgi:1-acyl-sn-glycerol-3-phosphate acyltransferase
VAVPSHATARRIVGAWLDADFRVDVGDAPLVLPPDGRGVWFLANHRSFLDAHVVERALDAYGSSLNLWVVAGPKVQEGFRAVFAASLNIVPVPQPAGVEGGRALRDLAREARKAIDTARALVTGGSAVLLFPEGTRTRTGRIGAWQRGVARYLSPGDWVVPVALEGSEAIGGCIGGVEQESLPATKATVRATFLPPLEVDAPEAALTAARHAVAAHLKDLAS